MNKTITSRIIASIAIAWGIITLKAGGTTLFIPEARAAAGDIVLFVLWINFLLGFAYITAGIGIFLKKPWAKTLSIAIAGITIVTYAAFGVNVALGGIYKIKTVKAMTVRSLGWVAIAYQTVKASKTDS